MSTTTAVITTTVHSSASFFNKFVNVFIQNLEGTVTFPDIKPKICLKCLFFTTK